MMMKFKVGDRVRVVRVNEPASFEPEIGFTFEIQKVNKEAGGGIYYYDETHDIGWMYENELELVEDLGENIVTKEMLDFFDKPLKNNSGKAQIGLVRPQFIEGIADVLTYGATKYDEPRGEDPNYMRGEGFHYSEIYDSLQRHLNTWYSGESTDSETNLNHLLHAASNLMFLYMYEISDKGKDDRFIVKEKDEN